MAKKLKIFVLVFVVALSLGLLAACAHNEYTLKYAAGEGGSVTGETEQVVQEGEDGSTVTAVADFGYKFVKWSDGVTTAERTDREVSGDITVTAEFEFDNMTVMNHVVKEIKANCLSLSCPSESVSEDIFYFDKETSSTYAQGEALFMGIQIVNNMIETIPIELDVVYQMNTDIGGLEQGKIQFKYNAEDLSYRIYYSYLNNAVNVIIYLKLADDFSVKYLDIVLLPVNNNFELTQARGYRFDFEKQRWLFLNPQASESSILQYSIKLVSEFNAFLNSESTENIIYNNALERFWMIYAYVRNTDGDGGCGTVVAEVENNYFTFSGGSTLLLETDDSTTITCVPDEEYRFVMWSDGVTSPTRTDVKPTDGNTLTLYAIVEKIN